MQASDRRAGLAARNECLLPYMIVHVIVRVPSTAVITIDWLRANDEEHALAASLLER